MTDPTPMQDLGEHFAYCIQVLGGTTTSARRLGIDERAIRRFISGERLVSRGLLDDTAKALRTLSAEATTAQERIAVLLGAQPDGPEPR